MYSIIYLDVIQLYIYVLNGQAIIHTVINRGFSRLQRIIKRSFPTIAAGKDPVFYVRLKDLTASVRHRSPVFRI